MTITNVRHLYAAGLNKPAIDALLEVENAANTGVTNAATAQTAADAAQTQADYSGYKGIGESVVLKTDASGTQPSNNLTADLIAVFLDEGGTQVASRTLRGTYTTAADTIAVTAQSTTGEATTYALSGDGTGSPSAVVTHTASEAIAVLAWVFSDLTTAGKDPSTGGGK